MEHFLDNWGYVALFAACFISSLGIPIGSEAAMAYGGVLASGTVVGIHHHFTLGAVIVVALAGEVSGTFAGYAIGYFGGRPLVDKVGRYILVTHHDLDRAEAWFARYGGATAFVGRLIPLARSFVGLAAGLAEMGMVKFTIAVVASSAIFVSALVSIGYSLGATWNSVVHKFSVVGYVVAALLVVAVVAAFWLRIRAMRAERMGQSQVRGAHSPAARRRAARHEMLERSTRRDLN